MGKASIRLQLFDAGSNADQIDLLRWTGGGRVEGVARLNAQSTFVFTMDEKSDQTRLNPAEPIEQIAGIVRADRQLNDRLDLRVGKRRRHAKNSVQRFELIVGGQRVAVRQHLENVVETLMDQIAGGSRRSSSGVVTGRGETKDSHRALMENRCRIGRS